jgi:hypothetical protein
LSHVKLGLRFKRSQMFDPTKLPFATDALVSKGLIGSRL